MSLFLRQIEHLLPRAEAWKLTVDKALTRFFAGLAAGAPTAFRAFIDAIWLDLWPEDTTQLPAWETQHGLPGTGTEADRRLALASAWQATGGQDPRYLQDTVRAAGFDLYLHEPWIARTPYSVATGVYRGKTFVSAAASLNGLAWGDSGRRLYAIDNSAAEILEFEAGTPFDVETLVATGASFDLSPHETFPSGIFAHSDGRRLYVIGSSSDRIHRIEMSADWDLSGAAHVAQSPTVTAQDASPQGLHFNSTGSTVYIVGGTNDRVYQYTLATAWDVTTLAYASLSYSYAGEDTDVRGVALSPDGSLMALAGNDTDSVLTYSLATPGNVSTATLIPTTLDVTTETVDISDVCFGGRGGNALGVNNGTQLYITDSNGNIFQYDLADHDAVDPRDHLASPTFGRTTCGATTSTCGAPDATCNRELTSALEYLVNKDLTNRAPPPLPTDSARFPFFLYWGAATFPNRALVDEARQAELERLLLKLCPAHCWIGLLIDYVGDDALVTEDGDFLLTEGGSPLLIES